MLWALGNEETRKTIETVHNECVSACLDWLDETVLRTRCEVNGVKKLTRTRGLIAAQFVHYDPRSGDPGSSHALPGFKQSPKPRRPMAQCRFTLVNEVCGYCIHPLQRTD